jgi:hypothetical protein
MDTRFLADTKEEVVAEVAAEAAIDAEVATGVAVEEEKEERDDNLDSWSDGSDPEREGGGAEGHHRVF